MQDSLSIFLIAICVYTCTSSTYLVNAHRNKFGDFSLGKGFDDVAQNVLDAHVFLEDAVTYDVIPELKSSMKCGIMQKASDAKSVLGLSGEISLSYGLISGKGFLSFDEEEEKMRRKVYFKCIIDRTIFTASVNPPTKSDSDVCKFSEVPHAVLAKNPPPEKTESVNNGNACKLLCCVNEWCKSADFNEDSKECLMYSTNAVGEGLEENEDFTHFDRIQKNNGLNPDAASITSSEVFRKLYGLHYVNSITFGRRYEVEVQVEYGHQSDYEKIAGKIEGKARFGLFEVSASFAIENENQNSESSLKLDISSNTYGFLETTGLRFPTGVDGAEAGTKLIQDIQDNIDAMVSADDKMFKGGSHLKKGEVLQMQNGAYPISYTTSSTKPYFPHAFGDERFDEQDMEEFLRNLGEAYDIKIDLRELLEDINVRSTTLYERFGLLTGKSELSKIFLETKRGMTKRIQKLLHLVRLYLEQVPEDIKDFDIYAWALDQNHAELDYLTIDQLTSDIEGLLGLTDLDMNDDSTAAECVFHGIYANIDEKQVKFAGTVHFSELEVRHVIFDVEGQVVSLGYIPRNEHGDVELVYVRNDCSMIRKGSQFWFGGARYEVVSIGNEDYMIGSRVEKPKLKNVRVYIRPKDIDVDNLILLTREDLQGVKLIGYEHSVEFSLDDDSRLLYKDGYLCDSGFGIDEARTVCTSLGYSRVDSFETNYPIPSSNAFGKPHITMDKLSCPPNTAWDNKASQNSCTWETQPSPRCSTDHGVRLICEAKEEYQSQCKVALWGSSNMDFDTKECMSDRFGDFLIDDNCNGGEDHLVVSSASVTGENCCVVLKDDAKNSLCALSHGEEIQGEDFTKRCGAVEAVEYQVLSVLDQAQLVLSVSVSGLQEGEYLTLQNRITGEEIQLSDSQSTGNFNTPGKCGVNYDITIANQPQLSRCVTMDQEGSFMLDHVALEVKCASSDVNECDANQMNACGGSFPCIDLMEDTLHHVMTLDDIGQATITYYDQVWQHSPPNVWTCTCSSCADQSLVGEWSCPGFYTGIISISSDFGNDFTPSLTNGHIDVCAEHGDVRNPAFADVVSGYFVLGDYISRSSMASVAKCQELCLETGGCKSINWWSSGSCILMSLNREEAEAQDRWQAGEGSDHYDVIPKYEVDYGNGMGWMPANTTFTSNLNFASDSGNYAWREVSEKLNNKASIALQPATKVSSTVGQTMKIRCRDKCEVYYIWMYRHILCTRHDNESSCRQKLVALSPTQSNFEVPDWKDEGVDVVAQMYVPAFLNYDLTKNPTGYAHGFYLQSMAAKSKVLNSEEITVGPARSQGHVYVVFIEN